MNKSDLPAATEYFKDVKGLKTLLSQHTQYIEQMETYIKEMNSKIVAKIADLRY